MKNRFFRKTLGAIFSVALLLCCSEGYAENIDPDNDGSQYAWGENVGWINFEPSFGSGVTVTDSAVEGYAWGENIGWINLSPTEGGVSNDGEGNLSGYAWGENVGWINFEPTGSGVTIDSATGLFSGYAWGENIGWINFAPIGGGVKTSWPDALAVHIDIKPGACPNRMNMNQKGRLPVAILGTVDFDVTAVNASTTRLSRDGVEGDVSPVLSSYDDYDDVGTPFDGELCDCHDLNGDGIQDLVLKFKRRELAEDLKLWQVLGQTVPLTVTGNLTEEFGSTAITGEDCVKVRPRVKGKARLVPIETSGVYGKARLVARANGKTKIVLKDFTGLTPGGTYAAHIRDGSCDGTILFTLNDVIVDDQGVARSVTTVNATVDFDTWWIEVGGVTCGKVKLVLK